ncbi:hypothetical protein MT356_08610 [Rathayibacter festucae]|uniref:hypothetical protein n=1 Tax=Rathayibacter festucae TaxID=110937 RepID=UPI001FB35A58|nr:hypothetical protein [Rathayibacter festucae]MCJ1699784.1 hypothetical protein [Rathayibacter festucae]
MTSHTSSRPLASGLVALVTTGALLLGAAPASAEGAHGAVSAPRSETARAGDSATSSTLEASAQLSAGQSIASGGPGGGYTFRMQDDGNAVTYDQAGRAVFSTGTSGRGNRLVMQEDGNAVIYSADDRPLWSTGTDIEPDSHLVIQADGNLVLYRVNGSPAWASSINGLIAEPPLSTLLTFEVLHRGHQLTSPNGRFRAVMQRDGNLVGYGPDGVVWNTGTRGTDNWLAVRPDSITVEREDGTRKWVAETGGGVDHVTLDDSGVLTVLDEDDAVLWTSQSGLPGAQMYAPNTLERDDLLRSDDGRYRAVMQADGNFVVYGPTGAIWQTATAGVESSFEFSKDGTAKVVAGNGAVTWASQPAAGGAPFRLVMQSDGNLVEYDGQGHAIWSLR